MIQDSILVCSPDPRIPHTALHEVSFGCMSPVTTSALGPSQQLAYHTVQGLEIESAEFKRASGEKQIYSCFGP
jgi:hypothetical protein